MIEIARRIKQLIWKWCHMNSKLCYISSFQMNFKPIFTSFAFFPSGPLWSRWALFSYLHISGLVLLHIISINQFVSSQYHLFHRFHVCPVFQEHHLVHLCRPLHRHQHDLGDNKQKHTWAFFLSKLKLLIQKALWLTWDTVQSWLTGYTVTTIQTF